MKITPMTKEYATAIARWEYPPPYSIYDLGDDPEVIRELLNGTFFAVTTADDELIGFFCYGAPAQVPGGHRLGLYLGEATIDIGLGIRPDLTGQGRGLDFVKAGLDFARERFTPKTIRLSVATFNQRAIRVYENAGFIPGPVFHIMTPNGMREFLLMTLDLEIPQF